MSNENKNDPLCEYIKTVLDTKGVSVVTVSDGWVFNFTKDFLKSLIDNPDASDSNVITVFVKSSEKLQKN